MYFILNINFAQFAIAEKLATDYFKYVDDKDTIEMGTDAEDSDGFFPAACMKYFKRGEELLKLRAHTLQNVYSPVQ